VRRLRCTWSRSLCWLHHTFTAKGSGVHARGGGHVGGGVPCPPVSHPVRLAFATAQRGAWGCGRCRTTLGDAMQERTERWIVDAQVAHRVLRIQRLAPSQISACCAVSRTQPCLPGRSRRRRQFRRHRHPALPTLARGSLCMYVCVHVSPWRSRHTKAPCPYRRQGSGGGHPLPRSCWPTPTPALPRSRATRACRFSDPCGGGGAGGYSWHAGKGRTRSRSLSWPAHAGVSSSLGGARTRRQRAHLGAHVGQQPSVKVPLALAGAPGQAQLVE
jgi:hypothetical protein